MSRARRDLVLLSAAAGIVIAVSTVFDAAEAVAGLCDQFEFLQLDEFLLTADVVGIASLVYAWRRYQETRAALAERDASERDVKWLAHHDPLTRLPNRRYLDDFARRLDTDASARRHHVVFSIDLDGFKKVNDLLGHAAGDALLQEVSARLKQTAPDHLVARIGGDEFVMIADQSRVKDPARLAGELTLAMARPMTIDGVHADVAASIGYAFFPAHGDTLPAVLQCADTAMYLAKRKGRNRIVAFEDGMRDLVLERARLERDLKAALAAGEIAPHFQPLVDLATGRVKGFEALARWRRTDGSFVPPSDFIPLAEEAGMIAELSDHLLSEAIDAARGWPADVYLSFNLSPLQLAEPGLGRRIVRELRAGGLDPSRLEIEVTESALIKEPLTAAKVLSDLHEAGVRIALDDFGTGYSSLSQLTRYAFDRIKIDRSFISTWGDDERQRKIVRAIVSLSEGLGVMTTAEGIEDEGQRRELLALGCLDGQGYLFGKALDRTQVQHALSARDDAEHWRRAGNY